MYPWDSYGFRVRVEHSRRKCADDVTANFKGLMDRRRLMQCSSDRLEILRVKCEWVEIAVPADRIEGMLCKRHSRKARSIFYKNINIFLLVDCDYLPPRVKIALGIRGAHFDLPFVIEV